MAELNLIVMVFAFATAIEAPVISAKRNKEPLTVPPPDFVIEILDHTIHYGNTRGELNTDLAIYFTY